LAEVEYVNYYINMTGVA